MKVPKFKSTWFEKQPTNPAYTLTMRLWANGHTIIFFNTKRLFLVLFFNVQNLTSQPTASLCHLNRACKQQVDRNLTALVGCEGKLTASVKAHTPMPNP